ncbi:UspA domain-containing protein [Natrinema pellirubrum DSM 15624]|uniref:Universal stress family protein n=2 Tax=Natrinema pellirubrum TaxID=69525 RepID=L0JT72_NATP1|nr:universal stress protein [Natrinema pellirubrum]AGB33591.1 universal stress family protein [Natrinema pellirubrum DSM 15624]ELY70448.1 UspA domain-containing protein [Natrinema pellirubrum DSM 15624]
MADSDPDRVLVPTLGRPREDEALAYALETFPDAEVTLLAVVTPLDAPLSEGGVLERDDERTAAARESATALLESVADSRPERVRIETAEGRPGTVVPRYASDEGIDHVVLYGSETGSTGFFRRFLGRGIAATVVERTAEPVTVLE